MKVYEFEARTIIREAIEDLFAEAEKKPKHKGKSTAKEKKASKKTLKTQEKGAKTFKGKAKKYYGWADDPEAALGAVYAKAGKNPKKEGRVHEVHEDYDDPRAIAQSEAEGEHLASLMSDEYPKVSELVIDAVLDVGIEVSDIMKVEVVYADEDPMESSTWSVMFRYPGTEWESGGESDEEVVVEDGEAYLPGAEIDHEAEAERRYFSLGE